MTVKSVIGLICWGALALPGFAQVATTGLSGQDEFVGPFSSWANVKTVYGAVGDGVTDDTAALQKALNEVGTGGKPWVLYIPSGTYRITAGLTMSSRKGISILGQDPASTIIKWGGAAGGSMFYLNGVAYARFGRITWDGGGVAATAIEHGWDGTGTNGGATYNEHADEYFQNVGYGIRGGSKGFMDAETMVARCRFINNSRAGISVENYNALDWFIWDSTFTNNAIGVTNVYGPNGGGNFQVYGSIFQGSTIADVEISTTSYIALRQNFSTGSQAFFIAETNSSASAPITLQKNTILDPVSIPISVANPGTVLMFDNVIRANSTQTGALVHVAEPNTTNPTAAVVAINNTYTLASPYDIQGKLININDQTVTRASITATAPASYPALTNYGRTVVDVTALTGDAIQNAIDSAVALNGQRPVVHLPPGSYSVARTIVIPNGSDIQLAGDGPIFATQLNWTGAGTGPILHLVGPSRATLRDFGTQGNAVNGVVIDNADQTNARVFFDQLNVQFHQLGLLANGLDNAELTVHGAYVDNDTTGVRVTGGAKAGAGQAFTARSDIFGGYTGINNITYDVTNGGRLMSQDIWYEGGAAQLVNLTGAGTFTLHGAQVAAQDPNHGGTQQNVPSIEANNFTGNLTILNALLASRNSIGVLGSATTNALAMGVVGPSDNANFFSDTATTGQYGLIQSKQATSIGGSVPVTDQTNVASGSLNAFIQTMVSQTRTEIPHAFTALSAGTTDTRFYRVALNSLGLAQTGIDLEPTGTTSTTAPVISGLASSAITSTGATISWTTDQAADTEVDYGLTTAYGSVSYTATGVTSHTVNLTGLSGGLVYHYRVKSRAASGYVAVSGDLTFTTPGNNTATAFVTSFSQTTLRSDFTNFIGMKFTLGPSVPAVTALGRICIAGNSGSHTVKIVRASDGSNVSGASAVVSMAGCTAGQFVYGTLGTPVILPANASYYLVSQETSGGDQFYDLGTVASSSLGTIVSGAFYDGTKWVTSGTANNAFGPANFLYTIQPSDTTPPTVSITAPANGASLSGQVTLTATASDNVAVAWVQYSVDGTPVGAQVGTAPYSYTLDTTALINGAHTLTATASDATGNVTTSAVVNVTVSNSLLAFITAFSNNVLRNNFSGFVGMKFTVGTTGLQVSSLGRVCVAGNSGVHTLKLVKVADGSDVTGGSVSVNMTGCTGGRFQYASLPAPIILQVNTSYYLVSQETTNGDQWYDFAPVTAANVATIPGPVYNAGNGWVSDVVAGYAYVPVSFIYTTQTGSSGPTVSITAPAPGTVTSGSTLAVTATAASSVGVANVQFQADGTSFGPLLTASPYTTNLDSTTIPNGAHILTAIATDTGGTSTTSAGVSITVNNPLPTVSITQPATGSSVSGTNLIVSATASSSLGLKNVQFQVDGANAGSALTTAPFNTVIDTTTLSNSTHVLTAIATDKAGNAVVSGAISITVSNSSGFQGVAAFVTNFTSGTLRNNFSGWLGMKFTVGSSPVTVVSLGRLFVTGNIASHTVKLVNASTGADVSGGSVTVAGGTAGQFQYAKLASAIVLPANSAYYLVSQEVNNGDQWYDVGPANVTTVATENGSVYSVNGINYTFLAGVNYTYVPVNFTYASGSATPPSVVVTAPASGATVAGKTVPVAATATSNLAISTVQFQIDGVNVATGSVSGSTYSATFDSTAQTNGTHQLTAVATDTAGSSATSTPVSFTILNNTTPPTVSVTAPAANATVSGATVALHATAAASSGLTIASVQFKIDGNVVGSPVTTAPYNTTFDSTKYANGAHQITALATDSVGSSTLSSAVAITISNTAPPTVAITSPANNAAITGNAVAVNVTASAAGGLTITSVQLKVDGSNYGAAKTATPYNFILDSTSLTNGSHQISAVATDSNGSASTATVTVTVGNAAAASAFITGSSLNVSRNNFTGWVGMKITVGSSPLSIVSLGRMYLTGNTGTHTVKLVNASNGTDVSGGSVAIPMTGGTAGLFTYALLPSAITLQANTSYYLVSQETSSGDSWYDLGSVQSTSAAAIAGPMYSLDSVNWTFFAAPGYTYVPVNFTYGNSSGASPPVVTITAPASNATVSGASVPLTATATPASGATIASVQFKVDSTVVATVTSSPYTATFNSTSFSNASHTITATATDSNSNAGSASVSVTVNNSTPAPVVSITAPAPNAIVSGASVTATATATSSIGIKNVQFLIDGLNVGAPVTSPPYTITFDSTAYSNATHTITAIATDTANNTGNATAVTFTVSNGGTVTTTGLVTSFGGSTSRNNFSGWVGMKFTVGSSPLTVVALGRLFLTGNTQTHTVKLVNAGTGADVAGGSVSIPMAGGTAGQTTYVNLSSPLALPAGGSYYLASQEFNNGDTWYDTGLTTSTNVAAVNGPVYSTDSSQWNFIAFANYEYVPVNLTYSTGTVTNAPPTATVTVPAASATVSGNAVTLTATATAASGLTVKNVQFKIDGTATGAALTTSPYTTAFDSTKLTNGTHSVTAVVTDSTNVAATSAAVSITVNNNPSVSVTAPAASTVVSGASVTMTATASAVSGLTIASVQFKIDGTAAGAALTASPYTTTFDSTKFTNASHSITAVATDSAGNTTTSAAVSFTVNNGTGPSVSITAPANNATVSGATVTLTASVTPANGTTISSVVFKIDNSTVLGTATTSPYTITFDSTKYTNASHTLSATATDSVANTGTGSVTVTINNNAAPTASITAPAANATVSGNAVTLTATATAGSGLTVKNVQFKIDGTAVGAALTTSPYTTTFDSTKYTNALHSITAVVTDSSNATGTSAAVSVTVNNNPTVAVTVPAANATVSGKTATMTATASAVSGLTIASVQFKIDNVAVGAALTTSPFTATLDSTKYTNATHSLTAVAIDSAGNTTTSAAVAFTVNNNPTVSITAPAANATLTGAAATLTATATPVSGLTIASVQFKIDNVAVGAALTTSPYTTTFDSTKYTNATHSITAVATDSAGNSTTSTAITVTVSNSGVSNGTAFITTSTLNSPRNNFTGFVGMKFTVGATALSVPSLGRMFIAGNTGTHTVKLVNASTGVDVPGGSVAIPMTGGTAGQFTYGTLTSPVTLPASSSYYLVSQETSGGDQFFDVGAVATTSAATINGSTYSTGGSYVVVLGANYTYVPVSFNYSLQSGGGSTPPTVSITAPAANASVSGSVTATATAAAASGLTISSVQFQIDGANAGTLATTSPYTATFDSAGYANGVHSLTALATDSAGNTTLSSPVSITINNASSGTPFVSAFSTAYSLRNNFTGWVGMKITVGSTALTVSSVGRVCVAGNTGTHTVKLVTAAGADVTGGSSTIAMSGCTAGQFKYGQLTSPVTLTANTVYYIASQETNGGDQWYDATSITTTGAATANGPVYSTDSASWVLTAVQNFAFVPINFKY